MSRSSNSRFPGSGRITQPVMNSGKVQDLQAFATFSPRRSLSRATRRVSAILPSTSDSDERRRHPSTIVRKGTGRDNCRIDNCDRLLSVATAMPGSSVIPAPLETICTRVGRLVARKPSSSKLLPEQYSRAWSRKQCPSSSSRMPQRETVVLHADRNNLSRR